MAVRRIGGCPNGSLREKMSFDMNAEPYSAIAQLFSDPRDVEILCSIYENEVSAGAIAKLLDISESEVAERLEILRKQSFVNRHQNEDGVFYSMVNPKVCDSILSLRDSIEHR